MNKDWYKWKDIDYPKLEEKIIFDDDPGLSFEEKVIETNKQD